MEKEKDYKFHVCVSYVDDTEFDFDVHISGRESSVVASMMMITRGVLMASSAYIATCYKEDGFDLCSYINR